MEFDINTCYLETKENYSIDCNSTRKPINKEPKQSIINLSVLYNILQAQPIPTTSSVSTDAPSYGSSPLSIVDRRSIAEEVRIYSVVRLTDHFSLAFSDVDSESGH